MSRIDRLKPTAFLGRRTLQPFVVPVYQYISPPPLSSCIKCRKEKICLQNKNKMWTWVCGLILNAHDVTTTSPYSNSDKYRVIHKSLRNFRTRLRDNQDRYGRKEHINRYRISQIFFCTRGLGVLAGSTARG